MVDAIKALGSNLFGLVWLLGQPVTFIILIAEDAGHGVRGFGSWALCIIADAILSAMWPLYWLLLRWIF